MNWIPISERIPESQYEVDVQDEHGNIGIGECCYYPFNVVENRGVTEIVPLDTPEADGSWLVLASLNLLNPLTGDIAFWRELTDNID